MKTILAALALALAFASPAAAQLHERGVARSGAVQSTIFGGSSFMCRIACTVEQGCAGWSWTRAGQGAPQARCDILSGSLQSKPDACCDSGLNGEPLTPVAGAVSGLRGNQYAGRSQIPTGPPVQLTADPTGGIWQAPTSEEAAQEAEDEEESNAFAEGEEDEERLTAEEEDDARFNSAEQAEAPTVTSAGTPSARIMSSAGQRNSGGAPRYSVQREYNAAPAAPAQQAPQGMANPDRWTGG